MPFQTIPSSARNQNHEEIKYQILFSRREKTTNNLIVILQAAPGSTSLKSKTVKELQILLKQQGIQTAALDHPGQGTRKEKSVFSFAQSSEDLQALYEYLKNKDNSIIVVGNSLGASITLDSAAQQMNEKDGLVLISPIIHPWEFIERFADKQIAPPGKIIDDYLQKNNINADAGDLLREVTSNRYNSNKILQQLREKWTLSADNLLVTRMEKDLKSRKEDIDDLYANLGIDHPESSYQEFEGYGGDKYSHSYGENHPELIKTIGQFIQRKKEH